MSIIFPSLVSAILILFISRNINFLIFEYSNLSSFENILIGFMVWIGFLFIIEHLLLTNSFQTVEIFKFFYLTLATFIFLGFRKFKYNKWTLFILLISFSILLISVRYRLGEQLGDNSYLTNMVTMNVNELYMNTTYFVNGFKNYTNGIDTNKLYLTWYHFFSSIIYAQQHIFTFFNLDFIPSYLIYVWTGNIVFILFSSGFLFSVLNLLKIRNKWLFFASILFYFYWNTIYYYFVLGHYGSNFVSLFVAGLWILLYQSGDMKLKNIWVYILSIYAISALGNVGLITSSYIVFAFSICEIIKKNKDIFLYIPSLLIPILHWIYILNNLVPTKWLIPFGLGASLLCWLIHFIKPLKEFIFKYFLYILGITLVVWYGLAYFTSDNYWVLFNDFFAIKSNFDRLQDYFSFVNLFDSLRNIAFYFALIGLFLNEKTRKVGWMVLIIFIFFINPIVYPMLYPPLQWLYHRAYISIFNMFVIMMGIYGLFDYLLKMKSRMKYGLMISWMLLLIPITYQQITVYFHPIYKPGPDFNVIYKLDNAEIEVLEKLRQIVDVEKYENAKVISQIYATTMYVPDVYQMYFNVYNHRAYDENTPDETYDDLYRIFFTPVYAGDDGPRFNAPYEKTCDLLISNQVDFIIYEKELSAYDENTQNWIPIHWYARGCAEQVIENDRFIMYRFYWK